MEPRRLLLAALLSLAVILAWQAILPPPTSSPPVTSEPSPEAAAPVPGPAAAAVAAPAATAGAPAVAPAVAVALPAEEAATEESLEVVLPAGRAVLSNRGAQLVAFELPQRESGNGGPVDVVRRRAAGPYPFGLLDPGGAPSALNDVLWVGERGGGGEEIRFRYRGAAGVGEKRFRFRPDGLFEVSIRLEGRPGFGVIVGPGIRNPPAAERDSQFGRRTAAYSMGGGVELVEARKLEARQAIPGGGLAWLGLQDTFFLAAVIPRRPVAGATLVPVIPDSEVAGAPVRWVDLPPEGGRTQEQDKRVRELAVELQAGGEEIDLLAFFGAKQYDRLAAVGLGLESTVERGRYIGILVQPLHKGLEWIHAHVVSNYGWAILLMTVLIKLLLLPLTMTSMRSMQKMQQLNPKIQAIRQKYRAKLKDKQGRPNLEAQRKMNEEVMALYKEEGVNPASGCLPLVLQLPILFAFYRLLYTTVELRQAPWVLWIRDLTAYDPFYVLPIVMGATQFLQQRLTPASGDPLQRRIFMLMPVIFTVLFLKFPSGLVLYWLTNNVLTIAQQVVYNRLRERGAAG